MTVSDGCEAGAAAFLSAAGLGFGAVRCARAIAGAAVRHEAARKRERVRKNDTDANLAETGRTVVTSGLPHFLPVCAFTAAIFFSSSA